jgi:hypothetical protein
MTKSDNELIAEFMGWEHCNSPSCIENNNLCWSKDCHSGYVSKDKLKFETSWDWLMPVVEKIEQTRVEIDKNGLGYEFMTFIQANECLIESHTRPTGREFISFRNSSLTKIESTYRAVVEFIKWYNTQKVNPVTV